MVADGHLVDALEHDLYSSCVKPISVKLLHVIAQKHNLEQLCGDDGSRYRDEHQHGGCCSAVRELPNSQR
jgi:hypothetical protein